MCLAAAPSFGSPSSFGANPSFSGNPTFGANPTFGGGPAFGAAPGFGSPPSFGSAPTFGSGVGGTTFGGSPSFGNTGSSPSRYGLCVLLWGGMVVYGVCCMVSWEWYAMAWCNWLVEVILPSEILEVFLQGVGCVISCGDVLCYIGCGMVGVWYGMVWHDITGF